MIQYPFYNFIILLIVFINILFSVSLDTALGPCKLFIFDENNNIETIENTIISYSNEVINKYEIVLRSPYTIHITKDLKDFYKKAKGRVPEWGIAVTKKNPNRIIMQSPSTARISFNKLLQILIHELNHVYLNNVLNSHSFPSWFKEGMAMDESGEFSINHRILLSSAKWKKELFSINELESFNQVTKRTSKLAYAESYAMFSALKFYYGNEIYKNIIKTMNQGHDFWDALVYITKNEEEVIKNNIESYLLKKYNWMFLLNAYNLIFIFLPLILIGGFFHKKYKNKKQLRKWEIEELLEDIKKNEEKN